MGTFIIFGAFGHLGFEIARFLLEEGNKVYHINVSDEFEDIRMIEDKSMLIGRNNNFHLSLDTLSEIDEENKIYMIFPFYDWTFFQEERKTAISHSIIHFFERYKCHEQQLHWIFLQAIQDEMEEWPQLCLPQWQNRTVKQQMTVYFPPLYGKWLPITSYFYQATQFEENRIHEDTISVEDAAGKAVRLIEEYDHGTFWLKNDNENRWNECYQFIHDINEKEAEYPLKKRKFHNSPIFVKENQESVNNALIESKQRILSYLSREEEITEHHPKNVKK